MDYTVKNNDIIVNEEHFDLDHTLDCGQAFRWKTVPSEHYRTYSGYFKNIPLTVSQTLPENGRFIFHNVSEKDFLEIWLDYFDFSADYGEIKRRFSEDKTLAAACGYARGIRLLRQDAWECLVSFIISQNNNIPRIKGIIDRLCGMYGCFPNPETMKGVTAEELSPLRAGFRAKYISDCVQKLTSGELDLERVKAMPLSEAEKALMTVKGIGPKVAACVLLFGMHRTEAYPQDVWIKRVNERYYPNGLPDCTKGMEGIAQQYLFHYIRSCGEAPQSDTDRTSR